MEQEYDILDLLPQRPPMVMVSRLLHCDPVLTETELSIDADNVMVDEGMFSAYGLMENIAQTCAARMGYINLSAGKEVRTGVIGSLRDISFYAFPEAGQTIRTRIEVSDEIFGMTLAKASTYCGENLLCEGTIKIALL